MGVSDLSLTALLAAIVVSAGVLAGPKIAVFVQPGMVTYGGAPALRPEQIAPLLRAHGLDAGSLDAAQLADPATFNAERYAVLVMPYGNAFPLPAFENLRAFHRAGGCLVLTGVPFCHPCVPIAPAGWGARWGKDAKWLEEGHSGKRSVRVTNTKRDWEGCTSTPRISVKPGEKFTISAWVRSRNNEADRDRLFIRFFGGGSFLGQDGPAIPANAADWTKVSKTVTIPDGCTEIDVSLQVWSRGGSVDIDDVVLTRAGSSKNLLENGGFERGGGEWHDLGHTDRYFGHTPSGIGTGGFGGPDINEGELLVPRGNPLGLRREILPRTTARIQWLDVSSLPPEDEVMPVIELRLPDQTRQVVAAAIRHNCQLFRGARDVWVGQVAGGWEMADRYAAGQLVVRGVAWCLADKGLISRSEFRRILFALAGEKKPPPLPDQIEIVDEPRPWGDTFFPKSKPPARELLVVDVRPLSPWEKLALTCLQGLTARKRPVIWLIFTDWDRRWLKWHKDAGYIDGWREVKDWRSLFEKFRDAYRGAVAPDIEQYQGVILACNVAACEDLIVAPPHLAQKLGLDVKIDLRGKFKTYADGMRWLWQNYRDRINHHLCIYAHPFTAFAGTLGYDIQWRGLIFWISGVKDGNRPGADSLAEKHVLAEIFSEMPPNIGMRGFPWAGEGIGLGEGGGVQFCGGYGKGLVCTDHTANICVMSGVRIDRLKPPPQPKRPKLEADKVYIAFTMSDGDNLNTFYDYFPRYFEHPAHGRFPVGWGMGPAIIDLMPAVAQWYYQNAKPGDEFLADVSGIFYVFPQTYAHRYRERWKVFAGFLEWTRRYMERLGMRTVRPHGGDDDRMARYAKAIPFLHSIFADYGWRGGSYERSVYSLPDGTPVFHGLTDWARGREGLLDEIRERVGKHRPAFVNAFLHNWTFDMDALEKIVREADDDMVFVTPQALAELYKEARRRGLAK